jgi:uncharacterized protein (DUF934 family)
MDRLEPDERASGEYAVSTGVEQSLDEWRAAGRPPGTSVRLAGDADLADDYQALTGATRILIDFPAFTDGRAFSHARKLRSLGYGGELLAAGDVLADQWVYLKRCGFSGLACAEACQRATTLPDFSDGYQAHSLQSQPLFRRR